MPETTYQDLKDELDRKIRELEEECNRPEASAWQREFRTSGILELIYQNLEDESELEELTKVARCFLGGTIVEIEKEFEKVNHCVCLHRKFMEGEADV